MTWSPFPKGRKNYHQMPLQKSHSPIEIRVVPRRIGARPSIHLPEQLRQPCHVDGDPARLVLRQHLGLPSFVFIVARVDVNESLAVGVADDIAARDLVGSPRRREAA